MFSREAHRIANVRALAVEALLTGGEHHKQWYLERILEATGESMVDVRANLLNEGYEAEPGIAP